MAKRKKADNQKRHAFRRCRERYGLYITDNDWFEMIRIIRSGGARFIEDETQRIKRYVLEYKEQRFSILFDVSRNTINTFLPKEALAKDLEKMKNVEPGSSGDGEGDPIIPEAAS